MYSLTIVGGGDISCGYDDPKSESILTHINGALKHPKIKLNSIVEINQNKWGNIYKKWGKNLTIYSNLKESIANYKSDIFVIATSTKKHLNVINDIIINYCPKIILCEKPIVSNSYEFKKLNQLLKKHNVKIITNFPRRFDISYNFLKDEISNSNHKYHFYGTFNKGLIHNGSHMIDLISMLVGPLSKIEAINYKIIDNDFFGNFFVKTKYCSGVISNINSKKLSIFEFTTYTDKGKFEIKDSSHEINIYRTGKSNQFKNFEIYHKKEELPYTLARSAYNTFDYIIKLLEKKTECKKLISEQYNVNKIIFDTQKKFLQV